MIKGFLSAFCLFILGLLCLDVPARAWWQSVQQNSIAASGACSEYTTWIARTSGTSGTEQAAYQTMICGMVTDGTWALTDLLYIFATNTSTTALLNLKSASFSGTVNGSMTFTADSNYAGDASAAFIATAYTPGALNYTQNSSSMFAYVINNRSGGSASMCEIGNNNSGAGGNSAAIAPNNSALGYTQFINTTATNLVIAGQNSSQGMWAAIRTGASAEQAYKNGNTTAIGTNTDATSGLADLAFYISACRFGTSSAASNFSSDQISAVSIGGSMTATQASNHANRINGYMTALGINVY